MARRFMAAFFFITRMAFMAAACCLHGTALHGCLLLHHTHGLHGGCLLPSWHGASWLPSSSSHAWPSWRLPAAFMARRFMAAFFFITRMAFMAAACCLHGT